MPAELPALFHSGIRMTTVAHRIWETFLREGDCAVDLTAGNGHDTLFLAKHVLPVKEKSATIGPGCVWAFDIQTTAAASTRQLLERELTPEQLRRVSVINECHSNLKQYIQHKDVRLVCFNLGYLPKGDMQITTTPETTLAALDASLEVLAIGGHISILAYAGHPGGMEEYEAVRSWAAKLSPHYWGCSLHEFVKSPESAKLLLICRRK
ncbi:hypothetical protein KFL_001630020 [Klebsormidium nitens]|uniref:rRNA methylase n=1 Tax=Klebsormidium nitens TaxID=105231 RepID=A0A1Y1HYS7_KLENI|nr:hypothetical protein KFL_001630020 [Klebsormidium nitens]|eukprot:GAQ83804.1 hypothetical protein KFL_001630020 [Klebsormidium nitens]